MSNDITNAVFQFTKQLTNMLKAYAPPDMMVNLDVAEGFAQQITDALKTEKYTAITSNDAEDIAVEAREYGICYILENFDREAVIEAGSNLYQVVSDKVYQFIEDTLYENYNFGDGWDEMMHGAVIDVISEQISWSEIWEAIDMVLEAPITFEEKLREIGMSITDFI